MRTRLLLIGRADRCPPSHAPADSPAESVHVRTTFWDNAYARIVAHGVELQMSRVGGYDPLEILIYDRGHEVGVPIFVVRGAVSATFGWSTAASFMHESTSAGVWAVYQKWEWCFLVRDAISCICPF